MFDEGHEEERTSGGGDDNLDDLFDNDEDDGDGEGYVEPEDEEAKEPEEPEKEEDSHNRSKEDLEGWLFVVLNSLITVLAYRAYCADAQHRIL